MIDSRIGQYRDILRTASDYKLDSVVTDDLFSRVSELETFRKKVLEVSEQLVSYKKDNQNEMLNGNIPQLILAINALNVALELVGEPKDNKPSSG